MAKQFLSPIKHAQGDSLPATGTTGEQFYLTTDQKLYTHNGTSWIAPASGGGNSFGTIAVPSGTNPVAEIANDTLNLVAGTGISITGDETADSVTIESTVVAPNTFSTIAVPSGTSPVADSTSDTLTLSAGAGISITGNSAADSITIATSGLISQTNGTVTTASSSSGVVRNIYTSVSTPTGGIDGDIWMVYN